MRDVAKFADEIVDHFFQGDGCDLEYADFLEIAVECGLVKSETYDPAKHHDCFGDPEPGDTIYTPVSEPKATEP
jgi:hypothetical protein